MKQQYSAHRTRYFSFSTIQSAYSEIKENQVRNIQKQRDRFLSRARELFDEISMASLSTPEIAKELDYEDETRDRIYFFLQDEGLIIPLRRGDKFTLPRDA